jgi:GAF domain-containing protein
VLSSGQPQVLAAGAADSRLGEGTASLLGGNPSSVLAVPVQSRHGVVGVLALVDATDGTFGIADAEGATLLAGVAAAALQDERLAGTTQVPSPAELAAELRHLAVGDPTRYAVVATIVESLVR